jgi:hypothetical protein
MEIDHPHPHQNHHMNHPPKQRTSARGLLLVSLSRFFADDHNMTSVLPYITGNSAVSLRLIDWFVTNYSKKHNVFITRRDAATGETSVVNIYQSYRSQLKAYSKQQFDPFRRRDRILFCYSTDASDASRRPAEVLSVSVSDSHQQSKEGSVETTIGQLNFFRWMLQNGILNYVTMHAMTIEADMVTWQHANHSSNDSGGDSEEGDEHAPVYEMTSTDPVPAGPSGQVWQSLPTGSGGRAARSELSTHSPSITMTRMGGVRTMAFE